MFFEREVQPDLNRHEHFLKPSEMAKQKHRRELRWRRKAAEKALERENQKKRHGKGVPWVMQRRGQTNAKPM